MAKTLVLAEKPSVGREIARVLGCKIKKDGYIEGDEYIVTWALGHLVTLADPEAYGDEYKKWSLETLPIMPDKMKLVVIKETSKQFKAVSALLKGDAVSDLVIATDAGREGELVARWIIEKAGFKKPVKRLWISSQTDKAIKEGFASLRDAKEYDNLYHAAVCRAEADWLVGLNVTRALTCKHNAQLSAGRVQTPTLFMLVKREEEIRSFVPKAYYLLGADMGAFTLHHRNRDGSARISDGERAAQLAKKITGKNAVIKSVVKKEKRTQPPLLYDLTELQRDANKKFGYSAKQTLSIMQRLYETHKLLTYPRTDSRYISDDIVPTLMDRVKSVAVDRFRSPAALVIKRGIVPTKRFVDASKVTDHHAIIPTDQFLELSALTSEELNVYSLVVTRFLSALLPDAVYDSVSLSAEIDGEKFAASGSVIKEAGFLAVSKPDDEDETDEAEQKLPPLKEGDLLPVKKAILKEGKTKPPARFTEATLLTAMEHPGAFLSGELKEMKDTLEETGGLGTPATRADIIEKIFNTGYAERQGQSIFPTQKGTELIKIVPPDLKSPLLTARWETELAKISRGEEKKKAYIDKMRAYAENLVSEVILSDEKFRHNNVTKERCPLCGEPLLEVSGKHGKSLVCRDRDCGYRESLLKVTGLRCPECHKKLDLVGEGDKKTLVCRCGFREKYASFTKKLSEQKSSLNKREVARYMNNQKSENFAKSSLADALAGIKLD